MNQLTKLLLLAMISAGAIQANAIDFKLRARVAACVHFLRAGAIQTVHQIVHREGDYRGKHNLNAIKRYRHEQARLLAEHGPDHSELARYVWLLPAFTKMFNERDPRSHVGYFVLNSGGEVFYTTEDDEPREFIQNTILLVNKETHLIMAVRDARVLDQVPAAYRSKGRYWFSGVGDVDDAGFDLPALPAKKEPKP